MDEGKASDRRGDRRRGELDNALRRFRFFVANEIPIPEGFDSGV